mgnify:FL=1
MSTRRLKLVFVLLLTLPACGGTDGPSELGEGLSEETPTVLRETPDFISDSKLDTFLRVDWADDVTMVDRQAMGALTNFDWQRQTYTFDRNALNRAGVQLKSGQVLLMAGLALRRIKSVNQNGGTVTVTTGPATLEDAISDGEIGLDYETEYTPEMFKYSTMEFRQATVKDGMLTVGQPLEIDAGSVSVEINQGMASYEVTAGKYTYTMDFSLEGDRFQTAFNIVKESDNGPTIRYGVSGHIDAPRHRMRASYSDGKISNYSYQTEGLSGELTLSIAAAGSGSDSVSFPLPSPLFKYPILIGGVLPATIEVGALVAIQATVPQNVSASVQIENTYRFDSDIGFQLQDRSITPAAQLGPIQAKDGMVDLASKFVPVTAAMSLGFPRIGISILNGTLAGRLQTVFTLEGTLTFGPVCQSARISLLGEGAYDMTLFGGIPVSSGKTQFFDEVERELQDSCES